MLYSAATRGKQAPIYLFHPIEGSPPADQLRESVERDDIAKAMREILEQAVKDLQCDKRDRDTAREAENRIWQVAHTAALEQRRPLPDRVPVD